MVKIRLRRIGKKKAPFYRIVVADARTSMQSTTLAEIGTYDPLKEPAEVKINEEEAKKWLKNGAQPTETVARLFKNAGITK
ncbi:MAG TPA: 30S ribosomal protein S16 [Lachnospiraceae bacterium]|jgi:small subunit ribosomal protein S16|nr:30S ribosomal protein S16 [Lachnospiraceae bacterium]MBQ9443305.1 30S ribosomal protein S16 [Lachnospiraceae bacterium]HAL32131.1 30S ribosomal protein S16 [Lachnospiraceae bacterium]HBB59392.1 30S ribosomal protein S16 [Lachnospiraceae bacterium]HCR99774.1 30S ribosomal protein S16 [Lachnospiraceae bacterium]